MAKRTRCDIMADALAQLKARGKAGSVIAAAIANRWMRGLFHELQALETPALLAAA